MDATIYDVRVAPDQIGRIDVANLSKHAVDALGFEKTLAELGTAIPLYRVSQSVRLAGTDITIGTHVPYITNSANTQRGDTINTVSYARIGAIYSLLGKSTGTDSITLDLAVQISTLSEGYIPVSGDVKAPLFRNSQMVYKGPVTPKQPFVVISVDAAARDSKGKAVAYIARVTLGTPQP
jgi:hypothetical protein